MRAPIVFLDRDGTINFDFGYITDPNRIELLKGAAPAVAKFKRAGMRVVIVTNQSAIGREMATHEQVQATNSRLCEMLLEENPDAEIDSVVYCPHSPEEGCRCRKPETGLLEEIDLDGTALEQCWMVGDKSSDLAFGANAGIPEEHCLLVLTGEGEKTLEKIRESGQDLPKYCGNLAEAADVILGESK